MDPKTRPGTHANEALDVVRRYYDAVNAERPDPDVYGALLAEGFTDNDRPEAARPDMSDRAVVLDNFARLERAFAGAVHRVNFLEPIGVDRAVVHWTFEGRHEAPYFDVPASGRPVSINGIDIWRAADGKLVEQWHVENLRSLFAQIAPTE